MAGENYDVFISYRRSKGKYDTYLKAGRMNDALKARQIRCFYDFDELKDRKFDDKILRAIEDAPIFFALLAPDYFCSCADSDDWVRKEIECAIKNNKKIIPINIDNLFDAEIHIPENVPYNVSNGIIGHQFSEVYTQTTFQDNIEAIIRDRIKNEFKNIGKTPSNKAKIEINTDADCVLFKGGEEIAQLQTQKCNFIYLNRGRHKLQFHSVKYSDIKVEQIITIPAELPYEDFMDINLMPLIEEKNNKIKRAEEEKRKDEEKRKQIQREEELKRREEEEKSKELDNATAYFNTGNDYFDKDDYSKALEYHLKALRIQEKVLGDHTDTATTYNNIGNDYSWQNDHSKALEYPLKALRIREKVLGDHTDTANTYNDIGNDYSWQDNDTKALEYHLKALRIREKVLGDHKDTATTYNDIGDDYYYQDNYTKALEYHLKALRIREKVLGDHKDTASTYNRIGYDYYSQNEYTKALEYHLKALRIREKVLGDHKDTATTYNDIGDDYYCQGDYSKALEYYNKALSIREKVLGLEHPDTKTVIDNIEFTKWKM